MKNNKIISKNSHSYNINNKINNKFKKTKNSINNQGIIKKKMLYIFIRNEDKKQF